MTENVKASPKEALLLIDAVRQVIADPGTRFHWRRLHQRLVSSDDKQSHQLAYERIQREVAPIGIGGFHRAVFLAEIFSVKREIDNAGKILEEIRPVHADRIMSFVNYLWADRLVNVDSTKHLSEVIREANIPALLALVVGGIGQVKSDRTQPVLDIRRVAIYTLQLNDSKHPPTLITLEHAKLLRELGLDVKIFSSQELQIPDCREYLSNDGVIHNNPFDWQLLQSMGLDAAVEVVRAQDTFSLSLRYEDVFNLINAYDPDVVFFIGNHSPMLQPLFKRFPVLALNVNSQAPMGDYDVWLSAKKEDEIVDQLERQRHFYHPFRTRAKQAQTNAAPVLFEKRVGNIILITVGSRLNEEIQVDWATEMLAVCKQFPNVTWLLVGGAGELPKALKIQETNQIVVFPHTTNIAAYYQLSDIYVNPPRVGGGFSVAEAMAEGVVALAFKNTDGGNKLLDLASHDFTEYFSTLRELIASEEIRAKRAAQMVELFETYINMKNAAPSLYLALEKAAREFNARIAVE